MWGIKELVILKIQAVSFLYFGSRSDLLHEHVHNRGLGLRRDHRVRCSAHAKSAHATPCAILAVFYSVSCAHSAAAGKGPLLHHTDVTQGRFPRMQPEAG